MHSEFQDSKISPSNFLLYKNTPASDLVRNVNPRGQRKVIMGKRHINSLSPETQTNQLIQSMLLTRISHQFSSNNNNNNSSNGLLNNSKMNSTQQIQLLPTIVGHGTSNTLQQQPIRRSFLSEKRLQVPLTQHVEDKLEGHQLQHSQFNKTTHTPNTNNTSDNPNNSIEDKRLSQKTVRSDFIKQKFENLMKNTFCLRSKHTRGSSFSPESFNEQFQQYGALSFAVQANSPSTQVSSQPSMLGIFMKNNKTITASSLLQEAEIYDGQLNWKIKKNNNNNKSNKNSFNNESKSKYDNIYKMMELQDPLQKNLTEGGAYQDKNNPGMLLQGQLKNEQYPYKRMRADSQDTLQPLEFLAVQKKTLLTRSAFQSVTSLQTKNRLDNPSAQESLQSLPQLPWQISQQQSQYFPSSIKQIFNQSQDTFNQSQDEPPVMSLIEPKKRTSLTIGMIHQGANQMHKPLIHMQQQSVVKDSGQQMYSEHNSNINGINTNAQEAQSKFGLKSIRSFKRVDDFKNTNSSQDMEIEQENENEDGNPSKGIQKLFKTFKEGEETNKVIRKTQEQKKNQNQQHFMQIKVTEPFSEEEMDLEHLNQFQLNSTKQGINQEDKRKDDNDLLENSGDFEQNVEDNQENEGFVMKKTIDFSQLKELRDKTINRLNGTNAVRKAPQLKIVISQEQGAKTRLFSATPASRKIYTPTSSQREIQSPDSTGKSKFNTAQDKEKSFFSNTQTIKNLKNNNRLFRTNSSSDSLKQSDKSGDNTPSSSLFKEKFQQLRKEQSLDESQSSGKSTKRKLRHEKSAQSSLKSYFGRGAQGKKKSKNEQKEEQNKEEQQRNADKEIAGKLEEVKDKVRAGVKVVIRDQIQKRLVSTLAQSVIGNNSIINSSRNGQIPSGLDSPIRNSPKINNSTNPPANQSSFGAAFKAQQLLQSSSGSGGAGSRMNPTYDEQQKEVAEYSTAIMNFFDVCIDNLNEKPTSFSNDFPLRQLKNFNETMSENLLKSFEVEMTKQNMSTESINRFRYIYEINTKMHLFYSGLVQSLGGMENVKHLIEEVLRKVSSHVTMFPINHVYSFEVMNRRIIPGICALLCDDQSLFISTLWHFLEANQTEHFDFSFIDFFFIKKVLFSVLTHKTTTQISTPLALSIMQKIESTRRYIFPIHVLDDNELREDITNRLFDCESFKAFFNPEQFNHESLRQLLDCLYDYFYSDSSDKEITDFERFNNLLQQLLLKKLSRKIIDFIELFTQQALEQDRYTLQVVIRDLHYKCTKVRLKLGFNQGIFGIFQFEQNQELLQAISQEVTNSAQYHEELSHLSEVETTKLSDLSFLRYYMQFLLSEYDIFSVYDFSVAMPYFGVTHKMFAFWMNCLRSVLLTKYLFQSTQADTFIRFVEACCTSV